MFSIRVDRAVMAFFGSSCALALALGVAGMSHADSTEGAGGATSKSAERAGTASAEPLKVAQSAPAEPARAEAIAPVDSTEVAAVAALDSAVAAVESATASAVFLDDAMPQGPSVAERLAIIREKIQQALEYPPLARLHDSDGEALLRFEIDRSGVARDVRVVRSSGHEQLDTSAVRAVQQASPLPWVYGQLEVPVHFELTN